MEAAEEEEDKKKEEKEKEKTNIVTKINKNQSLSKKEKLMDMFN
ncbi:MAG: hypothetical protein ABI851_13320 [Saprospiraceae bacterium]